MEREVVMDIERHRASIAFARATGRMTIREWLFFTGVMIAGAVPFVLDFSRLGVLAWYFSVVTVLAVGLLRTLQIRNQLSENEPKNKPDD